MPRIQAMVEDGLARRIIPRVLGGAGAGEVVARAMCGLASKRDGASTIGPA